MAVRDVIWQTGPSQSNGWGVNPGATGPDLAEVPYWDTLIGTSASVALHNLTGAASGGHGKDYTVGSGLYNLGYRPIIVNISKGSTFANRWIPSDATGCYASMISEVTAAWAAIRAAYPNDKFRHHHVSDQGEEEARYGYPSPSPAQIAVIDAWTSNYGESHDALEAILGPMQRWVIQTNSNIDNKVLPGRLEALQLAAADDALHFINRNGVTYEPDGVHMTTAGYIELGELFVSQFAQANPMGTLSAFARSTLVNHQNNKATYSPAATHYVHWYASGVALTSGNSPGYAANAVTNNTTTWPNASSRVKANGVAFTQTPSGTGLSPDEVRITDSATEGAGNVLASDTFSAVTWSVAAGPVSIAIGAFTITAPTNVAVGGFTDAVVHSLYNLMFGGTAYSQLATTYISHWAGDPAGAGAQAGSRVAMTQASQWGSASSGQAQSILAVSLTQQATGTYFAIHDAAAAGNLLMSCTRSASIGASGTILAGQLLTTML